MTGSVPVPPSYRLHYRDWLACPDDGRLYEILDGELHVSPPPEIRHQTIGRELEVALHLWLRRTGRGLMLHAPTGVRFDDANVVEPDIVVVLDEHRDRIGEQVIDGPPDVVVEILSRGTAGRDLNAKRALYARHGVSEYWLVDPRAETVELLSLRGDGYERTALLGRDETLRSDVLEGLEVPLSEVFRREP